MGAVRHNGGSRVLTLCAALLLSCSGVFFAAAGGDFKVHATALNPSSLVSTGIKNLGNICYMNAQLQCAFHVPAVRQAILMDDDEDDDESTTMGDENANEGDASATVPPPPPQKEANSDALLALRELFTSMVQAADHKLAAVAPRSFCMRLGIPIMVQQDSQEFWKLLLPAVGKESLSDLYKGSFEDYISALDGSGREKRREELFLDLSLDITSSSTLLDSLRSTFGEAELLSEAEGNGWRPEKGAEKVDAHKGSSLVAKGLPPILQCHLKRFNYDWQTDTMTKLNNRFSFPDVLDLSSLCKLGENEDEDAAIYDLQSVVIHMGEYGVGHYYSYVRPDIKSNTWFRFNDDVIDEVNYQEVIDDAFGGKSVKNGSGTSPNQGGGIFERLRRLFQGDGPSPYGWGGRMSNAYVVQYVRRCDLAMLYPKDD